MSRCLACSQENCGTRQCDCSCHSGERVHKYTVELCQGGEVYCSKIVEASSVEHARNHVQETVNKKPPKGLDLDKSYEIQVSRRFKITARIERRVDIEDI